MSVIQVRAKRTAISVMLRVLAIKTALVGVSHRPKTGNIKIPIDLATWTYAPLFFEVLVVSIQSSIIPEDDRFGPPWILIVLMLFVKQFICPDLCHEKDCSLSNQEM